MEALSRWLNDPQPATMGQIHMVVMFIMFLWILVMAVGLAVEANAKEWIKESERKRGL
jgi:hypothetical protein